MPEQSASVQGQSNQTRVESPVIVERRNGKVIWQLRATEAKQQLDGQMHLTSPELTLFTESGVQVPVGAKQALFDPLRRNIRFEGSVRVHYQAWQLESETLIFQSSNDQLSVPGKFKLKGKSIIASGKTMRIDRNKEKLYVDHGISIDDKAPAWTGSGS